MGGITLADNPPIDLEGSLALPNGLCHPNLLKELNLLGSASAGSLLASTANSTTLCNFNSADLTNNQTFANNNNNNNNNNNTANPTFSISDFLVPGLQTKVWEDWQGADDLQDFTSNAFDTQDFASDLNALPFQFGLDNMLGNTPIWDNNAIPADQAYDEFVFDLAPADFDVPTTVNIADLIAGPNSMTANTSISPLDLTAASTYQDLALANLYGFNDHSFESDSGSDLDDAEDSDSDDEENEDEDVEQDQSIEVTVHDDEIELAVEPASASVAPAASAPVKRDDPNKRRMEEALVARINNDLGEEHMAGLFKILNGTSEDDGADEMEVDLSCLDETTLVEVYQYVESCCMQTMGSILAAEERERAAIAAAHAAAAAASEMEAQERQRQMRYLERTPELSSSYSSASSISPSPPHPSSTPSPSKNKRGNNKRRRASPSSINYHEGEEYAQEALWPNSATTSGAETMVEHSSKGKRKRTNNSSMHGIGGGGTGKGRRIQKDQQAVMPSNILAGQAVVMEDEMEYGEDTEIDIVGI